MAIQFHPHATEEVAEAAAFEDFEIRKRVVRGYPFLIAYVIRREHVVVLAVAHAKRRPFYWLARTKDL